VVLQIIRKVALATLIERIAFQGLNPNERGSVSNMNISCTYCKEPLTQSGEAITVCSIERMYLFCSIRCRNLYGFKKRTNRICSREVCNNRVPEANRMLCPSCYQRGNHLGETEGSFSDTERAHWEWMEYALLRRIEEQVKVYSAQNMTQEELRMLVPSLQEEAA
jgi:hypothetical protein